MIANKACFFDSLLHRLHQCRHLAGRPETLGYTPEIFVRTLRDSYRLILEKPPLSNVHALCGELGIALNQGQAAALLAWESSLRGEDRYAELCVRQGEALELFALLQERLMRASV